MTTTTEKKKEAVPEPVPSWAWVILTVIIVSAVVWHYGIDLDGKKEKREYPTCADTAGRIEASLTGITEVPLHPKCKSGWVHLPYGFKGYLNPGINKELEVWFLDGRHVLAPKGKPVKFGDNPKNRDFQVRGDEGILRIEP